ncbi:hypothetical protein [Paenibacillus hexagrammi]|uniref:hypothetical protein n=1 Tax=Paenibacillus hexagrammi TaxID=2908839 RepID=UPI003313008C
MALGELHGFLGEGSRNEHVAREVRQIPGIVRALRHRNRAAEGRFQKRCVGSRFGEQRRRTELRPFRRAAAVGSDAVRTEHQPFGQRAGGWPGFDAAWQLQRQAL